jgi:hydroxymethylpyrimidine/phosphomethylpyrimidine kinase
MLCCQQFVAHCAGVFCHGFPTVSQKNNSLSVLLIGGSDSGGGAGLQADLRVMTAYRLAGACALTGATAQNTIAVRSLNLLRPAQVGAQIEAILDDIQISAIKIGMLGSAAIAREVAARIAHCKIPLVLDPVLIATSGGALLSATGLDWMRKHLLPRCSVLTPNLPEAEALLGHSIKSLRSRERACMELRDMGAQTVLLKGGHAHGSELIDLFLDNEGLVSLRAQRLRMRTHGTGCTLASAIAAELALGRPAAAAVARAHAYLQSALRNPLCLGASATCSPGFGSVNRTDTRKRR